MRTERLYYDDPWLHRFEAQVTAVTRLGERTALELDQSAFYPESGGQMADRGTIGPLAVVDVQLEGERVLHFVDGDAPGAGALVQATIDRGRRRSHMALHTGQHILSRALLEVGGHDTISSRLGETACTIDIDTEQMADSALADAEALANTVIDDDLEVLAHFPEHVEQLALRKAPPPKERIRVVQIGDFDVTPCGGTHCTRSAQVGLVSVTGVERHKRQLRISFVAGPRARATLAEHDRIVRELAKSFSCGPDNIAKGIDKLRAELDGARAEARELGSAAADLLAASLARAHDAGPVVAAMTGPVAIVREVAHRLTSEPGAVALLAAQGPDQTSVVLQRGEAADFDCGAFMRRLASAHDGRGGGRADRAEGRLPPGVHWQTIVRALLDGD